MEQQINKSFYAQETAARKWGMTIAGADEVGRGSLAGPVVVAAIIMDGDPNNYVEGVTDSKKLSEKKREALYDKILEKALSVGVAFVDREYIDEKGIAPATRRAFEQAVSKLDPPPSKVICDYITGLNLPMPYEAIVKGDEKVYSVAAASIVAKVSRDRYMRSMAETYPEYSFEKNKGYGTRQHKEAIEKYGLCPLHRRSFVIKDNAPEDDAKENVPRILGERGENAAALYLESEDYEILERNYRCKGSELDIIAVKDGCLVCVEVKAGRDGGARPAARINDKKRDAIYVGLEKYMRDNKLRDKGIAHIRIDVIEAYFDEDDTLTHIQHTENAVTY